MTTNQSRRSLVLAATPLLLLGWTGCYTVVPLGNQTPGPEREVVVELTAAGAERLSGVLGPTIVSARGRPVEWRTDSIALAMLATTTARGGEQFWHGERVAIPRDAVSRVSERRLSRGRSALLAAGVVVGGFLAGDAISGTSKGVPKPPPTGPGL